ncbi:MAG: DNA translocase FtsK [Minisyncoccia bacterium]
MAKETKKNNPKKQVEETEKTSRLKDATRHGIYAVIYFIVCLLLLLAAVGKAGVAGDVIFKAFFSLFGYGYYLLPVVSGMLGVSYIRSTIPELPLLHTISGGVLLLSALGTMEIFGGATAKVGGLFGHWIALPFVALFDTTVAVIIMLGLVLISSFILFDYRPSIGTITARIAGLFKKKEAVFDPNREPTITDSSVEPTEYKNTEAEQPEERKVTPKKTKEDSDDELVVLNKKPFKTHNYDAPPLALLEADRGKANVGDVKANANIIKRTLLNFGIEVEMDEVTTGPTFTQYALKPAAGVKLSRIAGLQSDLALALAAHPVRIEAPIPGKSLVGIEIPNKTKATVGLGSLLADERFKNAAKPLTVALGRDVAGRPHFVNLAKAPHALIAGTTGSGKSVTIHAIINSLLYRNGPEDLKLIFVDPKRVELTLYNNIPHLLTPVITDAKKAILALKWAAKEMDRRYDLLQAESVRDIESYHSNISGGKASNGDDAERMPYIVIIIDELADIMQAYPRELEAGIVRLAQMSRAVGIHLILSTQRPEVQVITGLIKANVPTRIALRVPTQMDSRTILDASGAEKLLGQGDMLYSGGEGQPSRLQSAYISEQEVKKVVNYLKDAYKEELLDTIELSGTPTMDKTIFDSTLDGDKNSEDDDLYEQARQIVVETRKASTSFLQRKLGIGYARAARLIDILEERGIVGPGNGAKPRDVLEGGVVRDEAGQNIISNNMDMI